MGTGTWCRQRGRSDITLLDDSSTASLRTFRDAGRSLYKNIQPISSYFSWLADYFPGASSYCLGSYCGNRTTVDCDPNVMGKSSHADTFAAGGLASGKSWAFRVKEQFVLWTMSAQYTDSYKVPLLMQHNWYTATFGRWWRRVIIFHACPWFGRNLFQRLFFWYTTNSSIQRSYDHGTRIQLLAIPRWRSWCRSVELLHQNRSTANTWLIINGSSSLSVDWRIDSPLNVQ